MGRVEGDLCVLCWDNVGCRRSEDLVPVLAGGERKGPLWPMLVKDVGKDCFQHVSRRRCL